MNIYMKSIIQSAVSTPNKLNDSLNKFVIVEVNKIKTLPNAFYFNASSLSSEMKSVWFSFDFFLIF
jgi:hypothetical protein